ncbi:MAG: hypothetical protein ACO3N7_00785 [Kiritimatiellia bacterium]
MKILLPFLCFLLTLHSNAAPLPEDVDNDLLMAATVHLYRWVLDENDIESVLSDGQLLCWVREINPDLDPGDSSRMLEVWMPQLKLQVTLRKADYRIPELDLQVRNDTFKIRNVLRGSAPDSADGYTEIRIPKTEIDSFAARAREQAVYPEGDFLEAIRLATRQQFIDYFTERGEAFPSGPQTLHLAPLSPVSNDLWIFWENQDKLLRLSSDTDLQDPELWQKMGLQLRIFDIRTQTVVHLHEARGSNAYMTRDQVGRYLFNCLILGKKLTLTPPEPKAVP